MENKTEQKHPRSEGDNGIDTEQKPAVCQQWSILFETTVPQTTQDMDIGETRSDEDTKENLDENLQRCQTFSHCSDKITSYGNLKQPKKEPGAYHRPDSENRPGEVVGDSTDCAIKKNFFDDVSTEMTTVTKPQTAEEGAPHTHPCSGGRRKQKTPRHLQHKFSWQPRLTQDGENCPGLEHRADCANQTSYNSEKKPSTLLQQDVYGQVKKHSNRQHDSQQTVITAKDLPCGVTEAQNMYYRYFEPAVVHGKLQTDIEIRPSLSCSSEQPRQYNFLTSQSVQADDSLESIMSLNEGRQGTKQRKTQTFFGHQRVSNPKPLRPTPGTRTKQSHKKNGSLVHILSVNNNRDSQKGDGPFVVDNLLRKMDSSYDKQAKSPSSVDNHPLLQRPRGAAVREAGMKRFVDDSHRGSNGAVSSGKQNHEQTCFLTKKKSGRVEADKWNRGDKPQQGRSFSHQLVNQRTQHAVIQTLNGTDEAFTTSDVPVSTTWISTEPGNQSNRAGDKQISATNRKASVDDEESSDLSPERLNKSVRSVMCLKNVCLEGKPHKRSVSMHAQSKHVGPLKARVEAESVQNSYSGDGLKRNKKSPRQTNHTGVAENESTRENSAKPVKNKPSCTSASLEPVVRLPCSPVPVYSPSFPGVMPPLTQVWTQQSSLGPATTVAGTSSVKEVVQPCYIPIMPKMPGVFPVVQTPLRVYGPYQASKPLTSVRVCSSEFHSGGTNVASALPGVTLKPGQTGQENKGKVPQMDSISSKVLSACQGSIPFLIFLPNINQSVNCSQSRLDTVTAPETTISTPESPVQPRGEGSATPANDTAFPKSSAGSHVDAKRAETRETKDCNNTFPPLETHSPKRYSADSLQLDQSKNVQESYSASAEDLTQTVSDETLPSRITGGRESHEAKPDTAANVPSELEVFSKQLGAQSQSASHKTPNNVDNPETAEADLSQGEYPVHPKGHASPEHAGDNASTIHNGKSSPIAAQKAQSPQTLKSGRKRTASKRYCSPTGLYLSDGSDDNDITPITSDEEWTPENDKDGQLGQSSEDDEQGQRSRRRDFRFIFRPVRKKNSDTVAQLGRGTESRQKKQKKETANVAKDTANQSKFQTHLPAKSDVQYQQTSNRNNAIPDQFSKNAAQDDYEPSTANQGRPGVKPRTGKNNISSAPTQNLSPEGHTPKKRRRTPYTEADLTCRICAKTFVNIYRLRRHEFSHGDERPYVCDVCGKAFKQSGHRNEHRLTHNANKRSFLCNICGVIITSRSSFR